MADDILTESIITPGFYSSISNYIHLLKLELKLKFNIWIGQGMKTSYKIEICEKISGNCMATYLVSC